MNFRRVAKSIAGTLVLPLALAGARAATVECTSTPGTRNHCAADTSAGVVLVKSMGAAACLLGKTWGYDHDGVWVSDGCSGQFFAGKATPDDVEKAQIKQKSPEYVPNAGFLLYEGEKGQIYMRLYSYVRYLNQRDLDPSFTNSFGNTIPVPQREDIQLAKVFIPFAGWFLTPKFRYYLYVWSSNASQGDPAQVVAAGNLSYVFNRFVTLGAGITSLPTTRSTEGQFPYWLTVDNRMIADEFFRGSYTSGFWLKGEIVAKLKYYVMVGNNLSTLGVSAAQLDNGLYTQAYSLQWLPTTGEFGLFGTFGDFDFHEQVATRFGAHFTHSREDAQEQPSTNAIENSQIRLTDGSNIFTPDLFGPGTTVERVTYQMASLDFGVKYRGFSVEGEYFQRWLDNYSGPGTGVIPSIDDHGFQLQTSAMAVRDVLQLYLSGSGIYGDYGNGSDLRAGLNWYIMKTRGLRLNTEVIRLRDCPVGYTAVPYPVGGNGYVLDVNFEMNF